jgi:subtilisin family serine protease
LYCNASAAPGNSQNAERGLLVKTRKNAASDNEVAAEVANGGGRVASKLDQIGVHVVRVPAEKWAKLKDKLSKNPKYDYVEEDAQGMGLWTPNDPSYGSQWHLAKIAAPAAWDVTTGSNTVIIAVLDSGIQMNHPDLQGRILPGWDYVNNDSDPSDDHGHGTATAGTAAAVGNNSVGVTGVAVNAKILPFKVLNSSNYGYYSAWSAAIMKAADQGARVISMSLGGTTSSSTLQNAVNYAWNKGSIVVVAAGNSGSSAPSYPAACTNALAVSATNSSDTRTGWSNYGSYVRISAPGEGILTTHRGGGYASWSGTSFSTPIVSGVAALIAARRPELSNTDIVNAILQGADDLGAAGRDDFYGYGRVNAARSLQIAVGTSTSDTTAPVASLSIPDAVSTLAGTAMVYGDASDNVGVTRVEVFVDGTKVAQSSTDSIDYSWDTKTVSNATHTVKVVAYDAAGNSGSKQQTVSVNNTTPPPPPPPPPTVTPDTTSPVAKITSPITGSRLKGGATKVTVSASDNVGIVRIEVFGDGKLLGSSNGSSASVKWISRRLSKGTHTITALAYDAAGNVGAAPAVSVTT